MRSCFTHKVTHCNTNNTSSGGVVISCRKMHSELQVTGEDGRYCVLKDCRSFSQTVRKVQQVMHVPLMQGSSRKGWISKSTFMHRCMKGHNRSQSLSLQARRESRRFVTAQARSKDQYAGTNRIVRKLEVSLGDPNMYADSCRLYCATEASIREELRDPKLSKSQTPIGAQLCSRCERNFPPARCQRRVCTNNMFSACFGASSGRTVTDLSGDSVTSLKSHHLMRIP
jgi:hypothetical protein